MIIFQNIGKGCPRPDLKNPFDEGELIDEKDKTNRTVPKEYKDTFLEDFTSFNKSVKAKFNPSKLKEAIISFNSNDWLFTQATALSSVVVEPNRYSINPKSNHLINANHNAWSNEIIKKYYKTFIGAHNYVDHIQEPSKSKGLIIDSILRKIPIDGSYVYYVDTLIATNKKRDPQWCNLIESGEVKFLSMGCTSTSLTCSRCGIASFDESDECDHMKYELGMSYFDDKGVKRRIASMVTDDKNLDGYKFMNFIELSYLSVDPAFSGAVKGHVIQVPENKVMSFKVPRKILKRSAFQTWANYIKGVPEFNGEILSDEDLQVSDYNI